MIADVIFLVLGHFWQGVVSFQYGQGLAEELQRFSLEEFTEIKSGQVRTSN